MERIAAIRAVARSPSSGSARRRRFSQLHGGDFVPAVQKPPVFALVCAGSGALLPEQVIVAQRGGEPSKCLSASRLMFDGSELVLLGMKRVPRGDIEGPQCHEGSEQLNWLRPALCQPPNKWLQRTVLPRSVRGARAPFHYARAPRFMRQRAAAELRG